MTKAQTFTEVSTNDQKSQQSHNNQILNPTQITDNKDKSAELFGDDNMVNTDGCCSEKQIEETKKVENPMELNNDRVQIKDIRSLE